MANTYVKIASVTVTGATAATIEFTSIPATYDDLIVKFSTRDNAALSYANIQLQFNNSGGTAYQDRLVYGNSTSALSAANTSQASTFFQYSNSASSTASTFSNGEIYIPNYAGSTNKSVSVDCVVESNASNVGIQSLSAQLWSNTAAITSIKLTPNTGGSSFVQYSTAVLYGIKKS